VTESNVVCARERERARGRFGSSSAVDGESGNDTRQRLIETLYDLMTLRQDSPPLSTENKLLLYKAILKPIWAYGVQLRDTANSNSNIEIVQRFQNKYLRIIVNTLWYVMNDTLHDLNAPYVRDEIKRLCQRYVDRTEEYPNVLATNLMKEVTITDRLKRIPQDLCT